MTSTARDRLVWDVEDLDPDDVARFGGKGAGLARMVRAGIPVPPGFVIGTDAFRAYHAGGAVGAHLQSEIDAALARLEERTGKRFAGGPADEPLLVSVRSGAPVSMPGMMDTVLNLGLDAARAVSFADRMNSPAFAVDTWLRFWRMFAEIVLDVDASDLERDVAAARAAALAAPGPVNFAALERAVVAALERGGAVVDTAPRAQLGAAISAVFRSWDSRRAKTYRANMGISDRLGTAVTIQAMVFGNRDAESGSGVAFSCNPNSGERGLFGEYVRGRQGEDLVNGTATPVDLSRSDGLDASLRAALWRFGRSLEALYRDAVDIEFTVESGRLYLLQVRPAKRTAEASVRIAVDGLTAGTITREEAVRRVTPEQLGKLLRPSFDGEALRQAQRLAAGIGSSPGHAAGAAMLTADEAADRAAKGERVILLRPTTSPQDIRGMLAADGIVTARGGALSHAAVVSRALDKPCIVGCESIDVDVANRRFRVAGAAYPEGTLLSIDGGSGQVYLADIPLRATATGRAELSQLIAAAGAISHAEVAVSALDFAEIARATGVAGDGIIAGLTDLLIAHGDIERLTAAIGALEDDASAAPAEAEIEGLARNAAARALDSSTGTPVAFRLPSFLSERARQIVPTWAALPARSLLPLGQPRFYLSIARGVAAAARGSGAVSLLLSGVSEYGEIERLQSRSGRTGRAGWAAPWCAASPACTTSRCMAPMGSTSGSTSMPSSRTAYGYPSELLSAPDVFAEYGKRGVLTTDPQRTLAPFLVAALGALLERIGPWRTGALCGPVAGDAMLQPLYAMGFRRFCVPVKDREAVCLRWLAPRSEFHRWAQSTAKP